MNSEHTTVRQIMSARRADPTDSEHELKYKYYILQIQDWDWTFSFGANDPDDIDGPYWDHRHLQLQCLAIGPLAKKAFSASLSLLPMHALDDNDARRKHNSDFVDQLTLVRKQLTGSLYLPHDVLATALQMMIAKRWHFVVIGTTEFKSGRASVKSYRLQAALDDDDLSVMSR